MKPNCGKYIKIQKLIGQGMGVMEAVEKVVKTATPTVKPAAPLTPLKIERQRGTGGNPNVKTLAERAQARLEQIRLEKEAVEQERNRKYMKSVHVSEYMKQGLTLQEAEALTIHKFPLLADPPETKATVNQSGCFPGRRTR